MSDGAQLFRLFVAPDDGEADGLVERRYAQRSYSVMGGSRTAREATFVATQGAGPGIVGTVTLRADAPGERLGADQLYGAELDILRASRQLCEFTRLAADVPDSGAHALEVLTALFHVAYLYATEIHQADCAVIEVNPRHVSFYRRALGFEVAGPERLNRRVNAPAVLLQGRFEVIAAGIAAEAGRRVPRARTLFPFTFRPETEADVRSRIVAIFGHRTPLHSAQ